MRVTISPATAAARFRTPKSIDADGAAADRFPRCGPGQPCCRRPPYPPDGARGFRLPESNRSPRRSAHWQRGYPAASVPSPCSVRARTWHDTPWQRRRSSGSLKRRAGVREDDRPFCTVGIGSVFAHESGGLLTHQKRAERRVPKRVECHTRFGFGDLLAKNAGNPAIDVVHDKRGSPKVANNILEQYRDGRWFGRIARVPAHAMGPIQILQHRFVRVPGCDADPHAALCKQPSAACADARTAANDDGYILHGRVRVVRLGLSHVSCSMCRRMSVTGEETSCRLFAMTAFGSDALTSAPEATWASISLSLKPSSARTGRLCSP